MSRLICDVAIIGAGTAGLAAERAARRAGARTLLIDDRFAGTTCASVGCMPSKLLIAAASAANSVRKAPVFGIKADLAAIDGAAVMARVRRERDSFVAATLKSIAQVPPSICIKQIARFTDRHTLSLDDGRVVDAKSIVIATGSQPHVPTQFQALGDLLLTNETIFELGELPKSVAVIGAGALGLELAQALARLGVETQVFDQSEHLAGLHDRYVAEELKSILRRELSLHLGVTIGIEARDGCATISWSGPSSGSKQFERVLVATGRPPSLNQLNLAATGIALDKHGTPEFAAETLQCGDASIFIAGDACGRRAVLHEASFEGTIAGRNAAAYPDVKSCKRAVALSIMFTDPPLAIVGEATTDSVTGQASYVDQGRAKVEARNSGRVRIYADQKGVITGAALLGPGMDHIADLFAWGIERGETVDAMLALPFYHPTFEEGLKPALREICGSVNAPGVSDLDDGSPPGT